MKLICCHVENFGCLSDFDFDFEDGLTVLYQPNGFGKSTLAAFIKAMLYGFPRTGKRSISENDRKKYLPWQGGKYGGFLIFSYNGIKYRVTRFFGITAAKDTYSLYDVTNRRESRKFGPNLGEELFQLDGDSYARSTYMPQLQGNINFSTTDIQAKLSNLVEDTNDINNYDSAVERLRKKRSGYKSYRGGSGEMNDLQQENYALQGKLDQADQWRNSLEQATQELDQLQQQKETKQQALKNLQEKITIQSTRAAALAKREQYETLEKNAKTAQEQLWNLNQQYPKGYPRREQADAFLAAADQLKATERQMGELEEPIQEKAILQKEKKWLDREGVEQQIQQGRNLCGKLSALDAQSKQEALTREETEKFVQLEQIFKAGVPEANKLDEALQQAEKLATKNSQYESINLSEEEQAELQQLRHFFHGAPPTQEEMDNYDASEQQIAQLAGDEAAHRLAEQDVTRLEELRKKFSRAVPTDEEITEYQKKCRVMDELEGKKNAQTTVTNQVMEQNKKKSLLPGICAGLGVVLALLGAVGFLLSQLAMGGVGLALGAVLLAAAGWLNTRQMISHAGTATVTTNAISQEELQQLYELKQQISEYLLQFYTDSSNPQIKLAQLSADSNAYGQLRQRWEVSEEYTGQIRQEMERVRKGVYELYQRYYSNQDYRPGCGGDLRQKAARYELLSSQSEQRQGQRLILGREIEMLAERLNDFLAPYVKDVKLEQYSRVIMDLRSSVQRFRDLKERQMAVQSDRDQIAAQQEVLRSQLKEILVRYNALQECMEAIDCVDQLDRRWREYEIARKKVENYQSKWSQLSRVKKSAEESIQAFVSEYGLEGNYLQIAQHLDVDLRDFERLSKEYARTQKELKEFQQQNPRLQDQSEPMGEELPDVATLQKSQQLIQQAVDEIDRNLSQVRDQRTSLQQKLEQLPQWQDQLEQNQQRLQEIAVKSDLLDAAISMLDQAKERLSNSYLTKVEESFLKYSNTLLEGKCGRLALDHDLNIILEESGSVHGLEYFSAGSVDCLTLCMHLALVDALFDKEAPCLVLDDPFVNLDDEHTQRALSMLEQLAKSHQILYLVCNSSRCTPE